MTASDSPDGQRRLHLDESDRCRAIAEYAGEQCQRFAVGGTDYCPLHLPDHIVDNTETSTVPVDGETAEDAKNGA